jgi:preprotein translocase subunit SecB
MNDEQQQPVFGIEKIYVKDLSLEVPNAPEVFLQAEQPQLEVQLEQEAVQVQDGLYEVTLVVTVSAKAGDKTLFLVEASQAGLFQIRNVGEDSMGAVLGMLCPNVLFPYARETISDTVNRAGFPAVNLAPVNFEAIYQQRLAQEAQQQGDDGPRIEIAH